MRILAYEHFTAGGRAGGAEPSPELRREGGAMLAALAHDLARAGHRPLVPVHGALPRRLERRLARAGVDLVRVGSASEAVREGLRGCEAAWIIAPETAGALESIARGVVDAERPLLGPEPDAIAVAASKLDTWRALHAAGVAVVETIDARDASAVARLGSGPLVVKPDDGVGGEGLVVLRTPEEVAPLARRSPRRLVAQPFVRGVAASVCVIAGAARALPLVAHTQAIRRAPRFRYIGGRGPLSGRRWDEARRVAAKAVRSIAGLRGLVGVDLVMEADCPYVVEVNPRLTTAYLGLRRLFRENLAALSLDALAGAPLPESLEPRHRGVRFRTDGRVTVLARRRVSRVGTARPAGGAR